MAHVFALRVVPGTPFPGLPLSLLAALTAHALTRMESEVVWRISGTPMERNVLLASVIFVSFKPSPVSSTNCLARRCVRGRCFLIATPHTHTHRRNARQFYNSSLLCRFVFLTCLSQTWLSTSVSETHFPLKTLLIIRVMQPYLHDRESRGHFGSRTTLRGSSHFCRILDDLSEEHLAISWKRGKANNKWW